MNTLITLLFIGGLFRFIFAILWFVLLVVTLMDLFRSAAPLTPNYYG